MNPRRQRYRWSLLLIAAVAMLVSACTGIQPLAEPAPSTATADSGMALDQVLPLDEQVRTGVLDNGLTYYIRQNDEPQNRAELWLAINAGSLLEDDDQQGLAHFLEHMLFNGTERFPGMGVVDFLESIGMAFGPDVNAYTSFDETVYTIQAPTDDAETLGRALDVLQDWAGAATLDPTEIDKERGVIVEEWRLRQETAAGRINQQTLPAILGDSRYSQRLPIGDMDVVRSAPPEAFERFYNDWYRPDLMAVIAVGDFDVDVMEEMIQARFGALENPAAAPERVSYDVPTGTGPTHLVITDPEQTVTQLQIWHRQPAAPLHTGEDYRRNLVRGLFYSVLNERLADIQRKPDAPFLSARAGSGEYVRPLQVNVAFVDVPEGGVESALEATLLEIERLARHGVTQGELARAKEEMLRFYQDLLQEQNNLESRNLADEYLAYFLSGVAAPGIEFEHALANQMVPAITAAEVNAVAADLSERDERVVIVTAPEKSAASLPTEEMLSDISASIAEKEIEPPAETVVASTLLETVPEPVAIVAQSAMPEVGISSFELANGVRVLLKPTDFMDDEILFTGFSLGGSSLVNDEDYPEAASIVSIVTQSGVGDFDQSSLEKALAGKSVAVVPYIRELTEGIEGSSAAADVETLFQLIYLYLTAPRADVDSFEVFKRQTIAALENRDLNPTAVLSDALTQTLYGDTIRRGPLPVEVVESLDLERAFAIYKERYADLDDAVFVFVGNLDEAEIKRLAQIYLGNLPTSDRTETWQDVMPDFPDEVVELDVYEGEGERSITQIVFTGPYTPTTEADVTLAAVETVLDVLIREKLREDLGGVYSSGVSVRGAALPDPTYIASIFFGSEPERVEELIQAAFAQVAELQANGPSDVDLAKAKSIALSQIEENLEQNAFWLDAIKNAEIYAYQAVTDPLEVAALIEALTAEEIQRAAQQIFDMDRYVQAVLLPASYE